MASLAECLPAGEAAPLPQSRAKSLEMQISELGMGCNSHSSKKVLLEGNELLVGDFSFHHLGWFCPSFISYLAFELAWFSVLYCIVFFKSHKNDTPPGPHLLTQENLS